MPWPYRIYFDHTKEQIAQRRLLLDHYGIYAQLSIFIPIILYNLYRLAVWVYSERQRSKDYSSVPSSPTLKKRRNSRRALWGRRRRSLVWWLGEEVKSGWGERGHWIAAGVWGAWLGFLCVHNSGDGMLIS